MPTPALVDIDPGRDVPGGVGLDELDAPYGDRLSAVLDEAWTRSPLPTILRWAERSQARPFEDTGLADDPFLSDMLPGGRRPAPSPLRSMEELNERYSDIGLTFSQPTREAVARLLADTRRRELARQHVLARGSRAGWGTHGTYFAAGLLATMADPINIASAFVPIVGPARFAQMAAHAGVTAARAGRGVVEGAVGAALVEPIVVAGAIAEDADYGAVDTLLNLAFGGVLGGGLHLAGGKIADIYRRRTGAPTLQERLSAAGAETREAVLKTAVAQTAEGRQVDVEPILDADAEAAADAGRAARIAAEQARQRRYIEERREAAERRVQEAAERRERELAALEAKAAEPIEVILEEQRLAADRLLNQFRAQGYGATENLVVPKSFKPDKEALQLARDLIRGGPPPPRRGDARRIVSLSQYVRARGGVDPDDPDASWLKTQDIGGASGLARRPKAAISGERTAGLSMDKMREAAVQDGYLSERADIADFLEALIEDANAPGTHRSVHDIDRIDERQMAYDSIADFIDRELELSTREMQPRELAWLLTQDPDRLRLHALLEDGRKLTLEEARERDFLMDRYIEEQVERNLPSAGRYPEDFAAGRPATLEEVEALHAEYRRATGRPVDSGPGVEIAALQRGGQEQAAPGAARGRTANRTAQADAGIERTAAGDQRVIPGAERIADAELAQRRAAGALRADRPQEASDFGLFDEGAARQTDLVDFANRQDAPDGDALADRGAAADLDEIASRGDLTDEKIEEAADFDLEHMELTGAEEAELAALEALVATADDYGKAVKALAECKAG